MPLSDFLEYYLTKDIILFFNKIKNTKLQKNMIDVKNKLHSHTKKEKLDKLSNNYHYLTEENYNKSIHIDKLNEYTVLKFPIKPSESLKQMAKQCLKNILKSQKIIVNDKPIHIKKCVVMDIMDTSTATFSGFHTDYQYSTFTGDAFNVWYLIENNENYGNMFLIESDEYKKKYTPCKFDYNYNDKLIPLCKMSHLDFATTFIPFKTQTHIGYLNEDRVKVTYTNIKNGECLIMTKHLMHRGDDKRKNNVQGFNFRVLVKNEDGSIDYNAYYKPSDKFPNHRWDQKNKKLYGVELFDFV
jgi:hypothetical protein